MNLEQVLEATAAHLSWYVSTVDAAYTAAQELPDDIKQYVTEVTTDITLTVPWNLAMVARRNLFSAGWRHQGGNGRSGFWSKDNVHMSLVETEAR